MKVGLAGIGILMAWLSSILKNVTHEDVTSRSVHSALIAEISTPRSNAATSHASCPDQLSKLRNTFLKQRLATMPGSSVFFPVPSPSSQLDSQYTQQFAGSILRQPLCLTFLSSS